MTYPPEDDREGSRGSPLEHDRGIVNGAMLAVAAFVIVAIGIVWYALTVDRSHIAASRQPAVERSVPDGTTGHGGPRTRAPAPNPTAK